MCLSLVLLSTIFLEAQPLVLKELIIPKQVPLGSSTTLNCKLDSNGSRLSYVKWFKDGREFCRYVPNTYPQIEMYSLPGFHMQDIICENTTVRLKRISLAASGTYKCEAAAPFRQTVMSSADMSVMLYPTTDPVITGIMPDYREGEIIRANCTASPSNPPPKLNWFINGMLAHGYMVHEYTEAVGPGGLYRRTLGLKILATEELFTGPGGTVLLVCVVSLPGLPPWRAAVAPKMVRAQFENLPELQLKVPPCDNSGTKSQDISKLILIVLCTNFFKAVVRYRF